jgi:phage terminase large subunit-like protein
MQKTFSLHPAQAAIYNSPARFKVCAAGRRFGKTFLAAVLLGINALKADHRGHPLSPENSVYYVAPTADQAKRLMWRRFRRLWADCIRGENINDGFFEMVNGRRVYIRGAENDEALRGEGYQYLVLDEYADMNPNVWDDILNPALMDVQGDVLFIGTPKGKNHFYKLFIGALEKPVSNLTGNNDHWKDWEAFHFESTDNPFLKKEEINRILNNPNVPRDVALREIKASFASRTASVLKPNDFEVILTEPTIGDLVICVDLAGFVTQDGNKVLRSDETAIAVTSILGEKWTVLEVQHGHWDVRESALRIVSTLREYPGARLGIEAGALSNACGPYLEEYMRQFQRYTHIEPLKHGGTKKTDRIAWALQGRSERKLIKLLQGPWNDYLLDQIGDFPDPLSHDDGIDALAYTDQMSNATFGAPEIEEWVPQDMEAGY